ncbi:hypothetical protein ACOSP7_007147 [Xanthoceras sorbifolium]
MEVHTMGPVLDEIQLELVIVEPIVTVSLREGVVPTVDKGKAVVENFTVVIPKPPLGKSVGPVVEQNIKAVAMHGSVNEEGPLHGFASENETLHDSVSKKEALFRTLLHGPNSKTVHEDCLGGLSHEVHSLAVASSTDSVLRGEKASSNGRRWKRRARERIEVDVDMAHKELGTKRLNPLGDAVDAQLVKKSRGDNRLSRGCRRFFFEDCWADLEECAHIVARC